MARIQLSILFCDTHGGYRVWDELEITLILVFRFVIRVTVEVRVERLALGLRLG
jgi:hypothetical protein